MAAGDALWERIIVALSPAVMALVGVGLSLRYARSTARETRHDAHEEEQRRYQRAEAVRLREALQRAYALFLTESHSIVSAHFKGERTQSMSESVALFDATVASGLAAKLLAPVDTGAQLDSYVNALSDMVQQPDDTNIARRAAVARIALFKLMRRDLGAEEKHA